MIALVIQLAFLTIQQGSYYQGEVNRSDETIEKGNVPRGMFYDSTGRVIVGNKAQAAIPLLVGRPLQQRVCGKLLLSWADF